MKKLLRLFVFLAVLALIAVGAPQSMPSVNGPLPVAASGYGWHTATWSMDDSTDSTQSGGGVYRVKAAFTWQTTDWHNTCYMPYPAAPDGTPQSAFTSAPKCAAYDWILVTRYPANHFFPSKIPANPIQCWVANSFLINVTIDYCGPIASQQNYPPYYYVYGMRFHLCVGIQNTPFNYCKYFKSTITIEGSSFWVWNSSES